MNTINTNLAPENQEGTNVLADSPNKSILEKIAEYAKKSTQVLVIGGMLALATPNMAEAQDFYSVINNDPRISEYFEKRK
ncbi:MAG: hypothetical protein LBD88_03250 [Candidatus Peribacteria bacterium]|jgi:hypothetical protein|nr:hypothetical protein [Candidatus Peribacteria bacterium]